jgi:hypothetical protein
MNPQLLRDNLRNVRRLKPDVVLLWGLEYWLWQAKQGRPALLEEVRHLMAEHRANR